MTGMGRGEVGAGWRESWRDRSANWKEVAGLDQVAAAEPVRGVVRF